MNSDFLNEEERPARHRRRGREPDFWQRLNKLLTLLVIAGVFCGIVVVFYPVWAKQQAMRARVDSLTQEKAKKTAQFQDARNKLELLKNDPDYVETIARDRLNVMKPGETIFRIELPHTLGTSVKHP